MAVSLSLKGKRVGLLDADIFGPTVPLMMNLKEVPLVDENNLMIPPINYGVKWFDYKLEKYKKIFIKFFFPVYQWVS